MRTLLAFLLMCVSALPLTSYATTSDFIVRTFVGQDTTPPTTPVIASAVPVASSQIDITWGPATDDNELTGYLLARDGVHIATTTQTTFSDTGLSASTTYSYTVRAYDWRLNISTSSDPVATTTLALPPAPQPTPTPTSTSVTSGSGRLMLSRSVTVTPSTDVATIEWSTSRPSRFELRWGRTDSYELGFIATERYREAHLTTITGLEPGTRYYYELVGFNTINDIPQILGRGSFTTLEPQVITRPPNVYGLFARVVGSDVELLWRNPQLAEGSTVRVVRNHLWYPLDPYDGMVVYQGEAQSYRDRGALSVYDEQFYTVFVIDGEGNVSSGAVTRVNRLGEGGGQMVGVVASGTERGEAIGPATTEIMLPKLDRDKIIITQGLRVATFADTELSLEADKNFTISIPKDALPQHLKSIVVTLIDPSNHRQAYAFLLRLNADETAYEATIAPVLLVGPSRLTVEVIDYTAATIGRYSKTLTFTETEKSGEVLFPDAFIPDRSVFVALSVGVGFLLILLLFVLWRRHRKERM